MKSFEYVAPKTLQDVFGFLGETWGQSEILAGGTDLITSMKQLIVAPDRLVSLRKVEELRTIKEENGALLIGSMVTLGELAAHPVVRKQFPAILTAVHGIASPQLWSVGTIGGDLCQRPRCWYFRNGLGRFGKDGQPSPAHDGDNRYHAIFGHDTGAAFVSASSLGPVLIALSAAVSIAASKGKPRQVEMTEFFRTPKSETERETVLKPNEIVTGVRIPLRGLKNATYEVRHRRGLDWPYVTATVAYAADGGKATQTRVVLGHVAPVPWLAPEAGKALDGSAVDAVVAAKCGEAAALGAKPLSRNAYKVQLVKVAVKRAASAAAGV